ncbi:heterokaryon incompatibility protein-domain-containing protein [Phaeosphaeria sp. MPI-PUGE-AT-0046c]|nr:heterokaryon incompatibility protein-domain-containing protein [Phaeosphaeria sp. MPI-PUGE-AT-0046c]
MIPEQRYPHVLPLFSPILSGSSNRERDEIDLSKRWLRTCLAEHDQCKARQTRNASSEGATRISMPTRLIQITSSSDTIESICLVARPKSEQIAIAYLALSHCWGGAEIVKLKKENLAQFYKSIPLETLPKTFLDAIRITVLLGHDYLWIDSLCIVQDSTEDWLQEAKVMGSVYRDSTLTIAAVGSKDSHGGCFLASRNIRGFQSYPRETFEMSLLETQDTEKIQPLHGRAWVLQEQCLSIRTINFGIHEISWECLETRASPRVPVLQPNRYSVSTKRCFEDLLVSRDMWTLYWWQLIRNYTSRTATFSTDRWEAIRGLATEVERIHGHHLLYGLWSHRVKLELLWAAVGDRGERLDIGVPSWSWLSITAPVQLNGLWISSYYPGIDATIQAPWFRSISSLNSEIRPYLTVSARMAPIEITQCIYSAREGEFGFIFKEGEEEFLGGRCNLDTAEEIHTAYALQLIRVRYDKTMETRSYGLVVVADVETKASWRRVGVYETNTYEPFTKRYGITLV